jgi:hypothetical protein
MRQAGLKQCLGALAVAVGWLVAVRWWLIPGLPHYTWVPNLGTVKALLQDTRGLLSLVGCGGIILPLALVGMRDAPPRVAPLKSLLVLLALPPLYAALSVRVEGRIVWGLYPFLIPFAVSLGLPRRAAAVPDMEPGRTTGTYS